MQLGVLWKSLGKLHLEHLRKWKKMYKHWDKTVINNQEFQKPVFQKYIIALGHQDLFLKISLIWKWKFLDLSLPGQLILVMFSISKTPTLQVS